MHEKYSLEVNENFVIGNGEFTIEEVFDFLNYFEKHGFKYICQGDENSSFCLSKKSYHESTKEKLRKDNESELEHLLQDKITKIESLNTRIHRMEKLIEENRIFFYEKYDKLLKERNDLAKIIKLQTIENSDEMKKFREGFAYKKPENTEDDDDFEGN